LNKTKPLFWKLYPTYLLLSLSALLIFVLFLNNSFINFYYNDTFSRLSEKAHLLKLQIAPLLGAGKIKEIADIVNRSSKLSNDRITVILPSGIVIADSSESPELMESHAHRPEIEKALNGDIGRSNRFSPTVQKEFLYYAIPLFYGDKIIGALRHSLSIEQIHNTISLFSGKIFFLCFIFIIVLSFIIAWHSQSIGRRLLIMKNHAEIIASGNFEKKIIVNKDDPSEIVLLSNSLNLMSTQLARNLKKIIEQKNEKEILISSMQDGILSVDMHWNLFHVSKTTFKIFNCPYNKDFKGKSIYEIFRISPILETIEFLYKNLVSVENEIELNDGTALLMKGSILKSQNGKNIGVILVFHDITRVRELELHRKQFAANVSHELRTPLTSIQGFIENLLDGSVDDTETRNKFLTIIKNQTTRLNCIVEDLLTLSQIENDKQIEMHLQELTPIINSAISNCAYKAQEQDIKIEFHPATDINVLVNSSLLELALINLINNAIKYGPEKGLISVFYELTGGQVAINVKDSGPGIPRQHLDRLFERFYSADKARSSHLGGSGLGLAIVKHIVLRFGGTVNVVSKEGHGSTFTILLPVKHS